MIDKERIKSFFEGINFFGYRFVKREDYKKAADDNSVERLKIINERNSLKEDVVKLKVVVDSLTKDNERLPFSIFIGDPTPQKAQERKTYVAEVAGFHKTHLHNKLMFMIHSIHLMFEDEETSDRQHAMLRGAVYAFRELDRWGDLMISERMGNEKGNVSAPDDGEQL